MSDIPGRCDLVYPRLSLVCALGHKALAVSHRLAGPLMPAHRGESLHPDMVGEVSNALLCSFQKTPRKVEVKASGSQRQRGFGQGQVAM